MVLLQEDAARRCAPTGPPRSDSPHGHASCRSAVSSLRLAATRCSHVLHGYRTVVTLVTVVIVARVPVVTVSELYHALQCCSPVLHGYRKCQRN